jgi:hypothetical protein
MLLLYHSLSKNARGFLILSFFVTIPVNFAKRGPWKLGGLHKNKMKYYTLFTKTLQIHAFFGEKWEGEGSACFTAAPPPTPQAAAPGPKGRDTPTEEGWRGGGRDDIFERKRCRQNIDTFLYNIIRLKFSSELCL